MARKKKKAVDVLDVKALKQKLWNHVMENGGDLDEAFDSFNGMRQELDRKLLEYVRSKAIEVKAFKLTLQGLKELKTSMAGMFVDASDQKAFDEAVTNIVEQEDLQKRFEYHESEMQRHAEAAKKLQEQLSSQ